MSEDDTTLFYDMTHSKVFLIMYILIGIMIGVLLYLHYVVEPQYNKIWEDHKAYIDTLSCKDLGKYLVQQSLNQSSSEYGQYNKEYLYANARLHGGVCN